MKSAPDAPESKFARYTRRTLIICVIAIPVLITASIVLRKMGGWSWSNWTEVGLAMALALGLLAALGRLSHALWATAQFAIAELLITFLAAGFTSMLLIQRFTAAMKEVRSESSTDIAVYGIMFTTFALFLSGSAWCWGVFGRAKGIPLHRGVVLVCGWISALGLVSFALLIVGLITMIGQTWSLRDMKFVGAFFLGSALALPGVFIERRVRRFVAAQQAAPPPSAQTPSPPSAP